MLEKSLVTGARPSWADIDEPAHTTAESHEPFFEDDALALRGDAESFVQLYHRYLRPVYTYIYSRTGNKQEAEDITSIAFERTWSSLNHYLPAPGGSFRGWLFTIAYRALSDHYRSKQPPSVALDSIAELLFDGRVGPEEQAVAAEQWRQVRGVMQTLSAEQREIICLRFLAELRYSEIAEVLGKREPAVKMAAYRGLDVLRRALAVESEE